MLRPDQLNDIDGTWHRIATIVGAIAGSMGTAAAMLGDVAAQVFGVPLPVVVAAAAGAGLARAVNDATGFFRALAGSVGWTIAGCAGAPLVTAVAPAAAAKLLDAQIAMPTTSLAGVALLIASSPLWWPKVWPWLSQWLPGKKSTPPTEDGKGGTP